MAKSAHILFFLPSASGGGAERVITTVAEVLGKRGHSVDLILGEGTSEPARELKNVNLITLEKDRLLTCVPPLVNYLRVSEPDVVVSTIYVSNILVSMSHFLAQSDSRLVLRVANTPSEHLSSHAIRHVIGRHTLPFVYRYADRIIAISEGVKSDLESAFSVPKQKIDVVHNPIDLDRIDNLMMERCDHEWIEDGDIDVILGIGRLTPQKDFSTLIHSFARVNDNRPSTRLLILGEGELRSELLSLAEDIGIADSVCFPGYVDNPFRYLAKSDLFVLSSAWEGFGNVLLESLACRCPIVSTDCPHGPNEILSDGKYGTLVPVGDTMEMAAAILNALQQSHDTECLRSRAMDFSVEQVVNQYEDVLLKY